MSGQSAGSPRTAAAPHRRRRGMPIWRYAFLASAGLMTVLTASGVGLFMGYVRTLPPIERLEYYDPPEVTSITDRTGHEPIGEFKQQQRYVVPISQIPRRLQLAVLAIEDGRFYEHVGIDPISVIRAFVVNFTAGRAIQGASTITQQLTRNILPEQVGNKKTLGRKIKEAILSFQIERRYSKAQILEFYLNHIAFLHSAFGVKAAALTYFSKDLDDLTLAECAMLAALPKGPGDYDPFMHPKRAKTRRNLVLKRMYDMNFIGRGAYEAALNEPLAPRRGYGAPSLYPYFLDALEKDLRRRYGLSEAYLREGGLRLTATVDSKIQQSCSEALRQGLVKVERLWQEAKPARHYEETKKWDGILRPGNTFLMQIDEVGHGGVKVSLDRYHGTIALPKVLPYYEAANIIEKGEWLDVRIDGVQGNGAIKGRMADVKPVQGAVVALDAHTGEVLGLAGGANYYAASGGSWNAAIQGGRQPGSAFKPFFYAEAMQRQLPPNGIIYDEPVEYGPYDKPYRPINYEKNFVGPMTLIEALEHSRNVVTIRLFEMLGVKKTVGIVRQFDFSHDTARWNLPAEISTCLGTIDASPLEIAAAYQVFVNNGVGVRPEYFRAALGRNGQLSLPVKHWEEPILDPIAAYQTLYMLRQVVTGGTGKTNIGDIFPSPPYPPICGKTGTTTNNRDCWFVGFTPDIVLAVQVGFDPPRPLGPKLTGGRVAGPIWAEAFRGILKSRRTWTMRYEAPDGIELVDICAATGKRVSEHCSDRDHKIFHGVPFRKGQAPAETCDGSNLTPLIAPVSGGEGGLTQGYARRASVIPGQEGGGGESDESGDSGDAPAATVPAASAPAGDVPAVSLQH